MMAEKGFSLVEVMIAIIVLAIGILAVSSLQLNSTGGNSLAGTITKAANFAAQRIEILKTLPYDDIQLQDKQAVGVAGNGVAGLSRPFPDLPTVLEPDFTGLVPDGLFNSPDGEYTICWNIAENFPLINTKTLRIIVISTGKSIQKIVTIDFIRVMDY